MAYGNALTVLADPTRRKVFERLRAAQVFVSLREGALRISPHLYNSERDIDRLLTVLAA